MGTIAAVLRGSGNRSRGRLLAGTLTVAVPCAAYTAVVVADRSWGSVSDAQAARIAIEVAGFCAVVVAALVLAIVEDEGTVPARNALVAGLVAVAATNLIFGVVLAAAESRVDGGLVFYPWLVGRYVAGGLFVLASVNTWRRGIGVWMGACLIALVALDAAIVLLRSALPEVVRLVEGATGLPTVVVASPRVHLALVAVPIALFALGAWLSGRAYVTSGVPILSFVCLALVVQTFTHLHELLHPAFFGPMVTSADVLRALSFLLLAAGAMVQVRRLSVDRAVTVRAQDADLRAHDALAQQLASLLEREQDFRAIVSHELTTPIATIRAFAHVLGREVRAAGGSEAALDAVEGIGTEARRLSELIARIDELRDLEAAEFRCDLRPVRLRTVLEEATAFVSGLPGGHRAVLYCDSDVRPWADPVRISQALRNVISNAARYSPPNSTISIAAGTTATGWVLVTVTDEGPGIPALEREAVLRRYARGSNSRGRRGTGLGLYVASRIVLAHGGVLRIEEPSDHEGTTIVIELPGPEHVPAIG